MSLYKYFDPERVDVISARRIRYSQPAAFNDPFEARPYFTGFAPEQAIARGYPLRFQRVLTDHYLSLPLSFKRKISMGQFLQGFEYMRPEVYEIFRQVGDSFVPTINTTMYDSFATKFGVLSLSEINDNLLMWSHYANSHTGFVLEFDESHNYFGGRNIEKNDLWRLHKVEYAHERPQTTIVELDMTKILLTKGKQWQYECEWRAFRPLNQSAVKIEALPYPIYLFDLPMECVRSVIFGARMLNQTKDLIRAAVRQNPMCVHIRLFQAEIDDKQYSLNLTDQS